MMQLLRITAFGTLSLLFIAQGAIAQGTETRGKPSVQVTIQHGSDQGPASIVVEASDAEGLDSLDIQCPEADSNYHTQLSRLTVDRQFKRSFTLPELFPAVSESKTAVRLEVTVRNTRGVTASAAVVVPPIPPNKGN
jgi:hypothetical protein